MNGNLKRKVLLLPHPVLSGTSPLPSSMGPELTLLQPSPSALEDQRELTEEKEMGQGWRGMSMGEALLPAGMRICSFLGYKEIRRGEQSQEHNAQITLPFTSALPPSLCSSKSLRQ